SRKDSRWQPLATQLRLTLDYWRYLDARYDHSPSLRARGASQAPTLAARVTRSAVAKSRPVLGAMRAAVRGLERATPHGQRIEARELHGIPPERVTVTGAQAYDHWFVQKATLSREAFCAKVGVPSDRPLLLYLCSSPFITPHEVPFVRRWIEAIRGASDRVLRHAAILIRPHPQNAEQWNDFDPSSYEAVGVWPRGGANPVDSEARADYFDSMFYSVAVVGVNTSALIESGIVGRPVYTVIADEFAGQQEGTLHFQHLKTVNGGLLTTAAS